VTNHHKAAQFMVGQSTNAILVDTFGGNLRYHFGG